VTHHATGRVLDAALDLLDRQIIDADGVPAGKVDDLRLQEMEDGSLVIVEILSGPGALAPRLGGRFGAAWRAVSHRLRPDPGSDSGISFGVVKRIDARVELSISRHHLDVNAFEHWVRDRVIGRLPGAGDAPQ
jgi:hypothetical protein